MWALTPDTRITSRFPGNKSSHRRSVRSKTCTLSTKGKFFRAQYTMGTAMLAIFCSCAVFSISRKQACRVCRAAFRYLSVYFGPEKRTRCLIRKKLCCCGFCARGLRDWGRRTTTHVTVPSEEGRVQQKYFRVTTTLMLSQRT